MPTRNKAIVGTKVRPVTKAARPGPGGDQVQSLVRALKLLNCIADLADNEVGVTELAQQVGLPASTAHRLLTTLEQENFARFDPDRRTWSIGVRAFITGNAFARTRNLARLARPLMRRLMEDSGETVNLAIEEDDRAVYVAQIECRQMMRVFARPGSSVPLHCSGVGKAILSGVSEAHLSKVLHSQGMPRLTVKTIMSPAALRDDLAAARRRGFAFDDEEHAVGLRCLSAPIRDETGDVIAAVSASGPLARIDDERIAPLGARVVEAAAAISASLGARP